MGKRKSNQARDSSVPMAFLHSTLVPALLMTIVPNFVVCVTNLVVNEGSHFRLATAHGFLDFFRKSWLAALPFDPETWCLVLGICLWAAMSILLLGGRKYKGPPTQNGFLPVYVDSGFTYYLLTLCLVLTIFASPSIFSAWYWYKKLCAVTGALVVFGFLYCFLLWVKGHVAPSPGEHGSSGNPLFDFYWGMELYPRVGSILDLKMWSNCRFGMMCWQLMVLLCWKAQLEHTGRWNWSMAASSILQTLYIAKFYWWEEGYMKSIDIILDRAGFYVSWGCICFLPTFYALTSLYLVENASDTSPLTFALVAGAGLGSVCLNYWTDYQRQLARNSGGKCLIWGRPAKVMRALYVDSEGRKRSNVLLASGFWGLSRHINYVFELCAALSWSLPGLNLGGANSLLPFSYFIFLFVLLVHRSFRDDHKCLQKYGKDWEDYCQLVPYKILPGIF